MESILNRAKLIKLLICDIDGVFTNGQLYIDNNGEELFKPFHIHDGLGVKLLMKSGVDVAIITAKTSKIVTHRMQALGITHLYQGYEDKIVPFEELARHLELSYEQIAYLGDDLPDLPVIRRCGLGIAVANATPFVKKYAHWCTQASGGQGAVRETCELIMQAQDTMAMLYERYL